MEQGQIKKHTTIQSIILHLLPGILTGVVYFSLRHPVQSWGFPSIFALVLAVAIVLVPFELGYLLYQGKEKSGKLTLQGIISYRRSIPWWENIVWTIVLFVSTGAIFSIMKPIEVSLYNQVFSWMPVLDNGLSGDYSRSVLVITYILFFFLIVIAGPWMEELYFRGYLLPRMKGKFAPIFHSFLFAAYHVFTPWLIPTRTLALLPLIYIVKNKIIYIGIAAHILVNSLDFFLAVVFIANMS